MAVHRMNEADATKSAPKRSSLWMLWLVMAVVFGFAVGSFSAMLFR
jgi:hypothetical protein